MNIKELRIGNLVGVTKDAYHSEKSGENCFKIEQILSNDVKFQGFGHLEHCKNLRGMPLTEQRLLDLGFNTNYKAGYIGIDVKHTDFVLTCPNKGKEKYFMWEFKQAGVHLYVELKHVHELQNLFFALTGEELKFKSELLTAINYEKNNRSSNNSTQR